MREDLVRKDNENYLKIKIKYLNFWKTTLLLIPKIKISFQKNVKLYFIYNDKYYNCFIW